MTLEHKHRIMEAADKYRSSVRSADSREKLAMLVYGVIVIAPSTPISGKYGTVLRTEGAGGHSANMEIEVEGRCYIIHNSRVRPAHP